MDPVTAAVVTAGLTTIGKPTAAVPRSVIEKIVSPSAEAFGQGVAAPFQAWLILAAWNSRLKYESVGFTTLGLHFIEACTAPSKSAWLREFSGFCV